MRTVRVLAAALLSASAAAVPVGLAGAAWATGPTPTDNATQACRGNGGNPVRSPGAGPLRPAAPKLRMLDGSRRPVAGSLVCATAAVVGTPAPGQSIGQRAVYWCYAPAANRPCTTQTYSQAFSESLGLVTAEVSISVIDRPDAPSFMRVWQEIAVREGDRLGPVQKSQIVKYRVVPAN